MDRISRCTPWTTQTYDPVVYRTVFASGSPLGIPFLEALVDDPRYDVVGVLTMPDMPSGRGMKMQPNIIAQCSCELWCPQENVKKPHSLRLNSKKYSSEAQEIYERLQSLDIDILYVVAYGHLIPQYILDIPKIAPINIHGSLLPEYRGASPLQQVFLDGREQTGITLMRMEEWLDSWPMIHKQIFKLWFSDTVADLIAKIKENTPKWSLDSIDDYVHGELHEQIQDEALVTHCGKIYKHDGQIDPLVDSLEAIYRKYKWYYLWPKISMNIKVRWNEYKLVIIEELTIAEQLYEEHKGKVLFVDLQYTLNPAVLSLRVKPEGKKAMSWDDFRRGYF